MAKIQRVEHTVTVVWTCDNGHVFESTFRADLPLPDYAVTSHMALFPHGEDVGSPEEVIICALCATHYVFSFRLTLSSYDVDVKSLGHVENIV